MQQTITWQKYDEVYPEATNADIENFCQLRAFFVSQDFYRAQLLICKSGGCTTINAGLWPSLETAQKAAEQKAIEVARNALEALQTAQS